MATSTERDETTVPLRGVDVPGASRQLACEAVVIRARPSVPCHHCEDPTRGGVHFCDLNLLLRRIREVAQRELTERGRNGGAR